MGGGNCGLNAKKVYARVQAGGAQATGRGKSFARLARELELHENVMRRWQREYEKEPGRAFPGKGQGRVWLEREAELERKIGQMTLENDFLKKALQRLEEQRLLGNAGGGKRSTRRSPKK